VREHDAKPFGAVLHAAAAVDVGGDAGVNEDVVDGYGAQDEEAAPGVQVLGKPAQGGGGRRWRTRCARRTCRGL
jgi:hypothetical protein